MNKVRREEILDYVTYGEKRPEIQRRIFEEKRRRRVHVGANLTFLFENPDTIRYQIQEMVRAERMVKDADIQHEVATYNELLGGPGELGCTLLIEIDDPAERAVKLTEWLDLPKHLYAVLEDGSRVPFSIDPRQIGDTRVSAVQYLKVDTKGRVPVAIGCDHPGVRAEAKLDEEQRAALRDDLHSAA